MSAIALAHELGTTDRTLRRLAEVGTIRSGRAERGLRRALPHEEAYLRAHWEILTGLRAALRTEPRVVAALLFGSVARGDDTPSSDIDLLVALKSEPSLREMHRLGKRLTRKVGRRVDLFNLDDLVIQGDQLGPILDEARPVVDRAGVWPQLMAIRPRLTTRRSALQRNQRLMSRSRRA